MQGIEHVMRDPAVQHIGSVALGTTTHHQTFRKLFWHRTECVLIKCHDVLGFHALLVGQVVAVVLVETSGHFRCVHNCTSNFFLKVGTTLPSTPKTPAQSGWYPLKLHCWGYTTPTKLHSRSNCPRPV